MVELRLHVGEAQPDKADSFLSAEHEGPVGRLQSAVSGGSGEGSHSGSGYVPTPTPTPTEKKEPSTLLPFAEVKSITLKQLGGPAGFPSAKDALKRDAQV